MLSSTSSSDTAWRGYLAKVLAFSSLVLGSVAIGDRLIERMTIQPAELQYQAMFGPRGGLDKIVLGTSMAAHGINPLHLDGPAADFYNFAYDGAGPVFFVEWYDLFKRYQGAPKVVLFSIDWYFFNGRLSRRVADDSEFLPTDVFIGRLLADEETRQTMLLSRFPIIKNRETVQQRLSRQGEWHQTLMAQYHRGFAPWRIKEPGRQRAKKEPLDPVSLTAFRRLLTHMKRDGVKVVFVQAPQYLPNAGLHPNEDALIARLASRHGIPVLNYNGTHRSAFNQDFSHYIDWAHLNELGSTRFSQRLNQDLKAVLR